MVDVWATCRVVINTGSGCDHCSCLVPCVHTDFRSPYRLVSRGFKRRSTHACLHDTGATYSPTWIGYSRYLLLHFRCRPDETSCGIFKESEMGFHHVAYWKIYKSTLLVYLLRFLLVLLMRSKRKVGEGTFYRLYVYMSIRLCM